MSRPRPRRPLARAALALSLVAAAALSAPAQNGIKVVATVNGESITDAEVGQRVSLTGRELTEETWAAARRELAEDILLANEARRLGILLNDVQVRAYWEGLLGVDPDFAASARVAGTTEMRQIDLARRGALAGIYMLHRVGMRGEFGDRIGPDPFLARMVVVTPRDLRDLYRAQGDELGRPAAVAFELYTCASEAVADAVRRGLESGLAPTTLEPRRAIARLSDLALRAPAVALDFLRTAPPGAVSPAWPEGEGFLVAHVVDRDRGQDAPAFQDVQEELERRLRQQRLAAARDVLVRRLLLEAAWWPSELFDEPAADRVAGPPRGQ